MLKFKQVMDNRNMDGDGEELEQMRENEEAFRKVVEEATSNISRILRSCHARNNVFFILNYNLNKLIS
jgi:epoxyqueuosine reductase QueG